MKQLLLSTAVIVALASFAPGPVQAQRGPAGAVDEVRAAETAFARSMADRSATAFASLIADEAVFFGSKTVQHGKPEVVAAWKRFFDGPAAPFSWAPAEVEVLASGTLGMTSGPV